MEAERHSVRLNVWMTAVALPALVLLISLGIWQLNRLDWKEALIAERAAGLAAEPVALKTVLRDGWEKHEFRRVYLEGNFRTDNFKLNTPIKVRKRPGYKLITLFETLTGQMVLVDRGWVPGTLKKDNLHTPSGKIALIGVLRSAGRKNSWLPDNMPEKDEWYFVDPRAMTLRNKNYNTRPFFIEVVPTPNPRNRLQVAESDRRGAWPMPLAFNAQQPNRHLEYAVTWFGLAATLVIIYIAFHWRHPTKH